jgi:hypothetical protein
MDSYSSEDVETGEEGSETEECSDEQTGITVLIAALSILNIQQVLNSICTCICNCIKQWKYHVRHLFTMLILFQVLINKYSISS